MHDYVGSCHCGSIAYRYNTAILPAEWSVRACQCSFCRLHAALTTSDTHGSVTFVIADPTALQRYRFGHRSADFLLCAHCGTYLAAIFSTEIGGFGVINVRTLTEPPHDLPEPQPVSLEDESPEARRVRRQSRWTPIRGPY